MYNAAGDHQENQLRTEQIAGPHGCLRRAALREFVEWIDEQEITAAALTDILRVHEYAYISHLESKVKQSMASAADGSAAAMAPTAMPPFYAPKGYLDIDTPLSSSSLDAAKRFCGGAMLAVDKVLQHDNKSEVPPPASFVIGRPPGHHAGPNGCVPPSAYWQRPDMTSSGFCLLNTVGVAAGHARNMYSVSTSGDNAILKGHPVNSRPLRVAIVDIDVHHGIYALKYYALIYLSSQNLLLYSGNGTEEIVRNLTPHTIYLPLPSSWAPVSVPSYKPWYNEDDAKDVFFSSIHLYDSPSFYPCSGEETPLSELGPDRDPPHIVNIGLTPIGPGTSNNALSKKARLRIELTNKQRMEYCAVASDELRSKVFQKLLPALSNFAPDLLLISSGFDAHYDDLYHYLNEDDFHWLTKSLSECCPRVVSVMEGGYSLKPVLLSGSTEVAATKAQLNRFSIVSSIDISTQTPADGKVGIAMSKASRGGKLASQKNVAPASTEGEISGAASSIPHLDGGLVKAVMAHACALTGRAGWA